MGMNQASLAIYLPVRGRRSPPTRQSAAQTPLRGGRRMHRSTLPPTRPPHPQEITRKKERGSVVAMTEVMFGLGGVFACFVQLALQARPHSSCSHMYLPRAATMPRNGPFSLIFVTPPPPRNATDWVGQPLRAAERLAGAGGPRGDPGPRDDRRVAQLRREPPVARPSRRAAVPMSKRHPGFGRAAALRRDARASLVLPPPRRAQAPSEGAGRRRGEDPPPHLRAAQAQVRRVQLRRHEPRDGAPHNPRHPPPNWPRACRCRAARRRGRRVPHLRPSARRRTPWRGCARSWRTPRGRPPSASGSSGRSWRSSARRRRGCVARRAPGGRPGACSRCGSIRDGAPRPPARHCCRSAGRSRSTS